jgi:glycosyltransferase involved in cell wall biosynthesis
MEKRELISVIIPVLNEQTGIEKTLSVVPRKKLSDMGYNLEIIVIDGDSSDLTQAIAQRMGARVFIEKRKGYGRAVKTGLSEAKGDILVTLDGDGTYPAELIAECIKQLKEKSLDFLSVNRFSNMQDGAMSFYHIVGNNILSFVMRLLYSVDVKDSQSGMVVMPKSFIQKINLKSDGFCMSEEIKIIGFKFFKALELDGRYYRRSGKAKLTTFRDGWRNLKYLFQYRSVLNSAVKSSPGILEEESI